MKQAFVLAVGVLTLLVMPACDQISIVPTCPSPETSPSDYADIGSAVWDGNVEAVQRFIDEGSDVNATDLDGNPLLLRPAGRGCSYDISIIEILIDAGADVNATDVEGNPVLHEAIWQSQIEIVRILIDAGADVNARDGDGDPPTPRSYLAKAFRSHTDSP